MCTATLITANDSPWRLRLVTNRDEQHSRPDATPPEIHPCGARTAIFPVDPVSGGTWVAVNDAGLVVTLLNLNTPGPKVPSPGRVSRGGVVPALMEYETVKQAAQAAKRLTAATMMPYRLLLADSDDFAVVRADGQTVAVDIQRLPDDPVMLTSSGLGDHLVEAPRRALFEKQPFGDETDQDAFHRHRWPESRHLSVAMHREDARTVSRTVIEVGADRVRMTYTPVTTNAEDGPTHALTLTREAEAKG